MPGAGAVPEALGRYVIERELGAGGFGRVLAARDPELQRTVAIKLLRGVGTGELHRGMALLHEARALARFTHEEALDALRAAVRGGGEPGAGGG